MFALALLTVFRASGTPPADIPIPREDPPGTLACELVHEQAQHIELRHGPDSTPLARLRYADALWMRFLVGTPGEIPTKLASRGVRLEGVLLPTDRPLRFAKPELVHGVLYVHPATDLDWVGGESGKLTVQITLPDRLTLLQEPPPLTRPCRDFALSHAGYPVAEPWPAATDQATLREEHVYLKTTPDGSVAARIDARELPEDQRRVRVYTEYPGWTRVGWLPPGARLDIVGWVAIGQLSPSDEAPTRPLGVPGLARGGAPFDATHRCPRNLALLVRSEGELVRVGHVRAQTPFRAGRKDVEGFAAVHFEGIETLGGEELLVTGDVLEKCSL